MVSGEVGRGSCEHVQVPGVTLLCFGRLKGSWRNSEGWPNSSDGPGVLSQEGFHLGAGAKGTVPCSQPVTCKFFSGGRGGG